MNQNVICIAGAHRSGTSMLTRLLHIFDVGLGPKEDLMPAATDNPDGFWENLRFVRLNDEILNAVGAAWDLPPWQDESFQKALLSPIRAKAKLLISSFENDPLWGWKDPRTCLTLPFWRELIPHFKTVIIVRNPLEVAYSMNRRNATSYALGLRLWEIYNRRLLSHAAPAERIVTNYQTFFDQPESELTRIANFCDLPRDQIASAAAIINTDRRHTTFSQEQLIDAGVSEAILALYDSLLNEARGVNSIARPKVEPEQTRASASASASERPDQLTGVAAKLDFTIPESETAKRDLALRHEHEQTIGQFRARIEALNQESAGEKIRAALEIGRRDGRITELQTAYAHLDELLLREQEGRNKVIDELNQVRERFTQTNRLLHAHSVQLADREAEAWSLSERLRKQLAETKRLLKLLEDAERAGDLLRKSRRWILVNPFAWLFAQFSKRKLRGFGHLDRVIEKYRAWKAAHPEAKELDNAIASLRTRQPHAPSLPESTTSEAADTQDFKPAPPRRPIEFLTPEDAEVTVIIPVFNQVDFTLACLASLQEHSDHIPFEVIVVDDCSTDASADLLENIPGLVYLRNEANLGFIGSCNLGAKKARGRYLLFLNNDTVVTPGWLARLYETFDFEPEAGLVGSKLVYPDGRLQEAGGIIWRDASGWNRGKFQDAEKPEYNFLREVDYCSAASVMIPKALFESLGGFDKRYIPAYYEDTDLAFKVRQSGRKVFYQPLSKVIHYEGATGGTDISAGTKKYQEVNRATFAAAWDDVLATKPANGDLAAWDQPPAGCQRILVIDHHVPLVDRDSGSLRMFQILTLLRQMGHRVTFLPDNLSDIPPYGDNLRKHGIEVLHFPYLKSVREYLQSAGEGFDVIVLSRRDFAAKHIASVRLHAPQARLIFDTVDLHFLREEREAALTQDAELRRGIEAKRWLEYDLIDQSDETWVVSPTEQELLQRERPDKSIKIVSNIVPVPGSATPFSLRRDILFIGSFKHTPNIDAAVFFTREIFSIVRKQLGDVKFYIIGEKAPPEVIILADESVIVTGFQPDVTPYFNSVRLSVAPLRYGAGVKGKINQSMGFGVPVVATSIAVEGMKLTHRKQILVADDPQSFAQATLELYQSEELWNQLSEAAVEMTKAMYSREAAGGQLAALFRTEESRTRLNGAAEGVPSRASES